jgi:methionyl-tRNA formyltransferase
MKILIITQNDYFSIPNNVKLLCESNFCLVTSVIVINSNSNIFNKKLYFIKGFGLLQSAKMLLQILFRKFNSVFHFLSFYYYKKLPTLKLLSKVFKFDYKTIDDINNIVFYDYIKALNIDLIVSFSAPVVFGKQLLSIPKLGCVNLHCSLLPRYAGLFPSFWALYENSNEFGATVHFMDNKIDNGDVLKQCKIRIKKPISIFKLIHLTKKIGGQLMLSVIDEMSSGVPVFPLKIPKPEFHYTWPTISEIKNFRNRGGELI